MNRLASAEWALAIVLTGGGLLAGDQILEHGFGMVPCPLCLMQRIWFMLAVAITYASLIHNPRWGIYPLVTCVSALIGAGFSIRQLWLQSLPADQVPACGPGVDYMFENLPLADVFAAMTRGTGDCAEVVGILGVPLPLWALAGFAVIILLALMQWRSGSLPASSKADASI